VELKGQPLTIDTGSGGQKQNPLVLSARQTLECLKSFAVEFGFTPSSRGRISIDRAAEPDEMEALLYEGLPDRCR